VSASEIIRQIEALPENEQREVFAFVDARMHALQGKPENRMSFNDAKKHVFTTYRDVLEKLAK
jgi:hypothetical protein